ARLGAKEGSILDAFDRERRAPVEDLRVGDRFVVRPGERIATDGVVQQGRSALDPAVVTGERVPVEVVPGVDAARATSDAGGRIVVGARRVGRDSALAQIARCVTEAQSGKASVQRLADRVAGVFVPVVMLIAAGALGFWL